MEKKYKRNLIFNINKFQIYILLPILISAFIILLLLSSFYYFSLHKSSMVYETQNTTTIIYKCALDSIEKILPLIIVFFAIVVIIMVIWTYRISNRLVGPFERIIKQMDEILAGEREQIAPLRRGDELFDELLSRINIFIEKSSHSDH